MPILIPYEELNEETLRGIIKAYVLSEGTDYGLVEYSLEEKIGRVLSQLKSQKAFIAFDEKDGTATILSKEQAKSILS